MCLLYSSIYVLYALNILLKNHCTCCPLHLLFPSTMVLDKDQRSLTPAWLFPFPRTNIGTLSPSGKCAQKRTSMRDGLAQATSGPTLFLQLTVSSSHEPSEPRLSHKGKSWKPVRTLREKSRKVQSLWRESKPFHYYLPSGVCVQFTW